VINTNLHAPETHRFQVSLWQIIGQICVFDSGLTPFNTLVCGKSLNSRPRNLASRNKRHRSMSCGAKCVSYLKPFRRGSPVWQTDRQTDGRTSYR